MLPHADDLRYFLCVCECKNISRAAELLGISQPSLSLAIKRLEDSAGVDLFVRKKSGVDLTRAGHLFKDRAEELLHLWQSISDEAKKSVDEISGRYVIGAHVSVMLISLIPVIKELMDMHKGLEISLEHGLSRVITDQVIAFDIDFALVVNPVRHPDLVIKEISRDVVSFFASSQGVNSDVLIYDPNLLQAQSLLRAVKGLEHKFKRTITTGSLEVIAKLVEEGVGVGLLPERAAIFGKNLVRWQIHLPLYHDRHCLIYRADAQKTKSSKKLALDLGRLLVTRGQTEAERVNSLIHQ